MGKERFMKDFNGEKIFSLEYDKETLQDMVLEKQEEIERLKEENKILKESLGIKSPSKEMLEGKYWETKEIKRLNNIINEAIKRSDELADWINEAEGAYSNLFLEIEEILKGADR